MSARGVSGCETEGESRCYLCVVATLNRELCFESGQAVPPQSGIRPHVQLASRFVIPINVIVLVRTLVDPWLDHECIDPILLLNHAICIWVK